MYMSDTQLLQVIDTSGQSTCVLGALFGKSKELTSVLYSRLRIEGEVTMVHLIEDYVGEILQLGTFIILPTVGIGGSHVDDGSTLTVDTCCLAEDAGCLIKPLAVNLHLEGVELTFEVARDALGPLTSHTLYHVVLTVGSAAFTCGVDGESDRLGCRRPE